MCGVGAEYFFLKGCSQLEWRLVFLSRTSWVFMPSCKTVVSDSNSGDAPRKNDVLRLWMQTTDWVYFGQWKRYNNMKEQKGNHDFIILCSKIQNWIFFYFLKPILLPPYLGPYTYRWFHAKFQDSRTNNKTRPPPSDPKRPLAVYTTVCYPSESIINYFYRKIIIDVVHWPPYVFLDFLATS